MITARFSLLAVAAAATSMITGSLAQPHRRHMKQHARDVTVVDYVTAPVVNIVVYVDQYGNTISRQEKTDFYQPAPTDYAPPVVTPVPTPTAVYEAPKPTKHTHKSKSKAHKTHKSHAPKPTPTSVAGGYTGNDGKLGKGIVYSPYHDNGLCKDASCIKNEMHDIFNSGIGANWVRIYGTDCEQVPNVLAAAKELGIKAMLGIYDIEDDNKFSTEVQQLIDGVNGDWSSVYLVSVGNEVVNNHGGDPYWVSKSVERAATARSSLRAKGFNGPVANADVWWRVMDAPALCGEDPVVPVNIHPYFDPSCPVENAGNFLAAQVEAVQKACPGKKVFVSETGWPTAGLPQAASIPSKANQDLFMELAAKALDDYIILGAYDENWKPDNKYLVEHHWGVLGTSPSN